MALRLLRVHLVRLGVLVGFENVVSGSLWDLRGDARGAKLGPENVFRRYLVPKNLWNRREHNFASEILYKHLDEIPCGLKISWRLPFRTSPISVEGSVTFSRIPSSEVKRVVFSGVGGSGRQPSRMCLFGKACSAWFPAWFSAVYAQLLHSASS